MKYQTFLSFVFILAILTNCQKPQSGGTTVAEGSMEGPKTSVVEDGVHTFAFYNVENLFDLEDNPDKADEDFLPDSEKGWDKTKYKLKLSNLATVISQLGDDDGPEVLGLCEVENKAVLEDLVKQKAIKKSKYGIVHYESSDNRGIDNALIYKKKFFQVNSSKTYKIDFPMEPGYTSRDVLLVSGLFQGEEIHFIVNHFPSRRGGEVESEPKRVQVAKKVREIVESLLAINANSKIIIMGDFNDEPSNKSIKETLMAKGSDFKPENKELFNAMASLDEKGWGSYNYRGNWNMLDQIIMSAGMFEAKSGWDYVDNSGQVYSPDYIRQKKPEKYKGTPLRSFAGRKYLAGYSDHFPVFIHVKQK